jgi:hypothetical protein
MLALLPLPAAASPEVNAPEWVYRGGAYRAFFASLQDAARRDRREALLGMIDYPLRVNGPGGRHRQHDRRSARANFDRIFTPGVRAAILRQRFETLFGGSRGVMVGSGEIWFDHICPRNRCAPPGLVRIEAVNIPPPEPRVPVDPACRNPAGICRRHDRADHLAGARLDPAARNPAVEHPAHRRWRLRAKTGMFAP